MAKLFSICILYNSKFSFMSKILGPNAVVVKMVHCTYSVIKDRFIQGPKPLFQDIIRTNFPLWPPLLLNRLGQSGQCTKWLNFLNMHSLQQQIQFHVKNFGNKCCRCKEGPLYLQCNQRQIYTRTKASASEYHQD